MSIVVLRLQDLAIRLSDCYYNIAIINAIIYYSFTVAFCGIEIFWSLRFGFENQKSIAINKAKSI